MDDVHLSLFNIPIQFERNGHKKNRKNPNDIRDNGRRALYGHYRENGRRALSLFNTPIKFERMIQWVG